ncbi:unnamed protein product [Larinioides sclopetarius]|uniref:Uncharacterized protein n=1 Tax=Larinioides sclopetarius TaxID=280406 RepID=A0AAV1Z9X4_9ARAC
MQINTKEVRPDILIRSLTRQQTPLVYSEASVIICIGIEAQHNQRLRAALLSSDWLNDVDGDNIPGQAGVDYPVHATVPEGTSFRCSDYDYAGYFGDVETGCQRFFVCDWWFHFECGKAPNMYELNLFRKIPLPVLPPPPRRPFPGPIPQPKMDLPPLPPPRPPQQREPKNLVLNSIEKGKNPNDRQNERDKKQKDTGKPQSWDPNAENKYKNPAQRGNPFRGEKEDQCNCQCAA